MKHYVIIGNGAAAVGCIEGIRSVDTEGKITVLSAENTPVYGRPLISYYLQGKTEDMSYRPADFYDKMGCEVLYAMSATAIDVTSRLITFDNGDKIAYDKLCIATGSSPFVPPTEGYDTVPHKFTFLTKADTLALEKALSPTARVLIVGAGLIGLKCAEGILDRVGKVSVVDMAPRVLSSILDDECAALIQSHLAAQGIEFHLGSAVAKYDTHTAHLTDGTDLDFDILVTAVGVRANTSLVADAGGSVARGIVVDDHMRTDLEDIYAAGDCTEGVDIFGEQKVLALLPNAVAGGQAAGKNMAGADAVYNRAFALNSIGFFGLHAHTAGIYAGEVFEEKGEGWIKRLYVKDDTLVGFIIIGKDERSGIYAALIRDKTPLSAIDFTAMRAVASTTALSAEMRAEKFGGAV